MYMKYFDIITAVFMTSFVTPFTALFRLILEDTEWPKLCQCVVKQHSSIHPLIIGVTGLHCVPVSIEYWIISAEIKY